MFRDTMPQAKIGGGQHMKRILKLAKINLLWIFKYRCKMPPGVFYSAEDIEFGEPVYISNDRLHLVRRCKASKVNPLHPYGIALVEPPIIRIITEGHYVDTFAPHNADNIYYH
jgi:hypothetical protein